MREQKANDNGFPVVGKQVKEQQIFPFDKLVEYDGATNKITINANVTINGDTNIGELDIDSGDAPKGQVLTADGDSGASWENRVAYLNLESESGNLTNAQIEVAEQDNVIITLDGQFYYKNSQSDESIVFKAPAKVVDDDTIAEKVVIDLSDNTYSYSYDVVATGGSFEPVYDDELDDASTNAPQTKVVYAALEEKANTEDIENGEIVAGKSQVAESLETQVGKLDQTPFSYMSSGGQTDIESGIQRSIKLVGVNLVKNQLAKELNSTNWSFEDNVNGTISSGEAVYSTSVSGYGLRSTSNIDMPGNHIMLVSYSAKTDNPLSLTTLLYGQAGVSKSNNITTTYTDYFQILTIPSGKVRGIAFFYTNTLNVNIYLKEIRIRDLTQRYGSNEVVDAIIGSDTSKQVERLLQFDSNILKDISYDAGSMLTVKTATLKSTGYNVWDEQWESGSIASNTGLDITSSYDIRSKNYIEVIPGQTYYFKTSTILKLRYYDINKNYIGNLDADGNANANNNTRKIPLNCKYIRFACELTTYNNDICIFQYWDGSRIGYEPYEERNETMPNTELNGVLKVDGSGNVYADGDELYPDNTQNKKRYGSYTFTGNESWTYIADDRWQLSFSQEQKNGAYVLSTNGIKVILTGSSLRVLLSDNPQITSSTNMNQVFPNGTDIRFELAEEQSLEANSYNPNLWADDFGHLQFLDENGNEINGLQGCEIFYKANISGFAESLYVRAEGEPENVVIQSERNADNLERDAVDTQLKNALGGTLRQVLCVKETLDFDDTDWVDLGELNWTYNGTYFYAEAPTNSFATVSFEDNFICSKYASADELSDKKITMNNTRYGSGKYIRIYDTSYTDATTLKAAMKGVLLAYEKASE